MSDNQIKFIKFLIFYKGLSPKQARNIACLFIK